MGLLDGTTQYSYYTTPSDYGNYQFVSLENIINGFIIQYVGEDKVFSKVNRTDVQFHAMRAIQELSYDVLKSFKTQEIEVANTLKMPLPHDYVNYVKLVKVDSNGIERILYPTGKTSNPFAIAQQSDGSYSYDYTANKRTFTITIPSNGAAGINDGDFLYLPFMSEDDNSDTQTVKFAHFIFDTALGFAGNGPYPTDGDWPRFGIQVAPTDTASDIANKLENRFKDFGHYNVITNVEGVLTVEYTDGFSTVSTTPNLSYTEGAYTENDNPGGGGANNTNIAIAITIAGGVSTGGNLSEQATGSDTWDNYQDQTLTSSSASDDTDMELSLEGRRYGLDPQYAQENGTFFIDQLRGMIHFGSTLAGATITLKYISVGLGTDEEMVVHKFCEEAVYKWIAYGVASCRANTPDPTLIRFKMEKATETRKAKIRLSNIKIEEFTQILKGVNKIIK